MTQSNTEFIADPTHHLIGVIDDVAHAVDAERALEEAGFEEVRLYRGRTGADAIDSDGATHGALESFVRTVQASLTNKDSLAEYEAAAARGQNVLTLKLESLDRREEALTIFDEHHAHEINYYGTALVETLRP